MFIIAIACFVGVASAAPSWSAGPIAAVDSVSIPRYNFNYAVSDPHTGDNKAQTEVRDGGYVKGSYSLSEPDGTIRVVDYSADPASGFNAVVKRLGPAVHPQQLYTAPIYTKQIVAPIAAAPIWGQYPALSNVGLGYGYGYDGLAGLGINGLGLSGFGINGLGHNGIGLNGVGLGGLGYWKH